MKKLMKKSFVIRIAKLIIFAIVLVFIVFLVKNGWSMSDAVNNMVSLFNLK